MIVVTGPASPMLGEKIAAKLGVAAHPVNHRLFPDGESYIRITEPMKDETVILVQTTAPDQDRKLMQLIMMANIAKEFGAHRVIAVVPYLAYMRQDKRFLEGEVVTFDLVLSLLEQAGVTDLLVVDLHSEEVLQSLEHKYTMKVHTLSAIPVIAEYLKHNGYDGAYSLSPDVGRKKIVSMASKVMGGGFAFFEKERDLHTGETTMKVKDIDIKGSNAVVFDDIISSGGTMAKAIKGLKEQGAEHVAAACTHPLLMPGAEEKLKAAGAEVVVATDTVESEYGNISIAELIAEYLKDLL